MHVERVFTIGVEMLEACWGQVDEILISYRMTFRSQLLDGRSHIDCIPGYHSIGEQIQAASLIGLGLFLFAPQGALSQS